MELHTNPSQLIHIPHTLWSLDCQIEMMANMGGLLSNQLVNASDLTSLPESVSLVFLKNQWGWVISLEDTEILRRTFLNYAKMDVFKCIFSSKYQ